jgi:hypothetical protein
MGQTDERNYDAERDEYRWKDSNGKEQIVSGLTFEGAKRRIKEIDNAEQRIYRLMGLGTPLSERPDGEPNPHRVSDREISEARYRLRKLRGY